MAKPTIMYEAQQPISCHATNQAELVSWMFYIYLEIILAFKAAKSGI